MLNPLEEPVSNDFKTLLPDVIFNAIKTQGYRPRGTLFPLNSYENRVYEIALEDGVPIIAKFYRPHRWSKAALIEEHRFILTLAELELPVIAPLALQQTHSITETLGEAAGFYYALYPKFRGRERLDLSNADRTQIGRILGRLHNAGAAFRSIHRPILTPEYFGDNSLDYILSQPDLPDDLGASLEDLLMDVLDRIEPFFHNDLEYQLVHGDCHWGNILWNGDGPHLLDFDDMIIAPPVQDLWMVLTDEGDALKRQEESLLEGYLQFRNFDTRTLILKEPLRTLRMIHHAAWIGQRYEEPAFKRAFPYYRERRYWEQFILSIKEQIGLLQDL